MPGPVKIPVSLKIIRGNPGHESKESLNKGPKWSGSFGSCPKYLDQEAKRLWRSLVPELEEKRLAAKVFRPMLEGLCLQYSRAVAAEKILAEKGLTFVYETASGSYEMPRPEVAVVNKAWAGFKAYCQEFGLSPASVSRVPVPGEAARPLSEIAAERAALNRKRSS